MTALLIRATVQKNFLYFCEGFFFTFTEIFKSPLHKKFVCN